MPGVVTKTTPTTVFPQTLSTQFTASWSPWNVRENSYPNAESCRFPYYGMTEGRRAWRMAKRLTSAEFSTLQTFYDARKGGYQPFYFYDPFELTTGQMPGDNYDPSGGTIAGRYVVRFAGQLVWQMSSPGLIDVEAELVEVAE